MARTFAGFTFLLVAIAVPLASLRADEPGKSELTKSGSGTLVLTGANTYSGGTTILSGGTLHLGSANCNPQTLTDWTSDSSKPTVVTVAGSGASAPTSPIPAGPVFYVITEGAGLGDSMRSVPCTGKQTVLDAIGHVNGLSQLSSTKIWIARPTPGSRDKSTILPVDWEAISKRGINTTNYTLVPGDRLVFGEDSLVTRTNLAGKKTAPVERLMGVVGSTYSTLYGFNSASAADVEVLKELMRKGYFTDDEELKQLMLDAIRLHEPENKKANPKAAAEQKAGQDQKPITPGPKLATEQRASQAEKTSVTAGAKQAAKQEPDQGTKKSIAAGDAPPHELAMQPLPDYRIEPPDVVEIEMLRLIPLPPYRAGVFDVLEIRANTPPNEPLENLYFMVEADGKVALGPPYGSVRVEGMTLEEVTSTLNKWLSPFLREPAVYVQLARVSGAQPVTGQYLVGPDGTVNLRLYGRVCLMGKTVAEARLAIQKQLAKYLKSPELSVDVAAYNSKVYYIITQGAGLGDNVRRLPITGKQTVLDALSQTNGLSQVSSKNIWIARPLASNPGKADILPVDWDGITARGATATNYQIFPGDRIYIGEDPLVTRSNLLSKKTAPVERTMGIVSLTSSMLSGLSTLSAADDAVMMELVRKGTFTSDEEMKGILQEALRLHAQEREKARSKEAEKGKPGQ